MAAQGQESKSLDIASGTNTRYRIAVEGFEAYLGTKARNDLQDAVRLELLDKNPAANVPNLKSTEAKRRPFTANIVVVAHLIMAGHLQEAISDAQKLLIRFPQKSRQIQGWLATVLWETRQYPDAIRAYRERWRPEHQELAVLEAAHENGRPEKAMRALAEHLVDRYSPDAGDPFRIASLYTGFVPLNRGWLGWAPMSLLSLSAHTRGPRLLHLRFMGRKGPTRICAVGKQSWRW